MRRDFTPAWDICLLLSLKLPPYSSPEVDFPPCPVKWVHSTDRSSLGRAKDIGSVDNDSRRDDCTAWWDAISAPMGQRGVPSGKRGALLCWLSGTVAIPPRCTIV